MSLERHTTIPLQMDYFEIAANRKQTYSPFFDHVG